jgi:hypothetical protein
MGDFASSFVIELSRMTSHTAIWSDGGPLFGPLISAIINARGQSP